MFTQWKQIGSFCGIYYGCRRRIGRSGLVSGRQPACGCDLHEVLRGVLRFVLGFATMRFLYVIVLCASLFGLLLIGSLIVARVGPIVMRVRLLE